MCGFIWFIQNILRKVYGQNNLNINISICGQQPWGSYADNEILMLYEVNLPKWNIKVSWLPILKLGYPWAFNCCLVFFTGRDLNKPFTSKVYYWPFICNLPIKIFHTFCLVIFCVELSWNYHKRRADRCCWKWNYKWQCNSFSFFFRQDDPSSPYCVLRNMSWHSDCWWFNLHTQDHQSDWHE